MRITLILLMTIPILGIELNTLVNYALKHSITIKRAKNQIEISKLKGKEHRLKRYGEVTAVGSYTHYNKERTLAPLPPSAMKSQNYIITSKNIFSIGVNYTVPLFTGYADIRNIKIADIQKRVANLKLKLTKEELAYNIRSLYLSGLSLKEMLKAQKSYIKALKKLEEDINLEIELGKKATIDLIKVEADLEEARANYQAIESDIEIVKASLSSLAGKKVKRLHPIKIRVTKSGLSTKRLIKKSLKLNRVKIQDLMVKKSSQMVKRAEAKKYPQVSLNVYVGKNYGKDVNLDKWGNEDISQISLNMKYNLCDFGVTDVKIEEAKLERLEAKLTKSQTLLELKKSIIKGVAEIKKSYANYKSAKKRYQLSKKAFKIEKVRYMHGASTINDLLLSEAKLFLSEAKVIQSRYDYQKSRYFLDYILERGVK